MNKYLLLLSIILLACAACGDSDTNTENTTAHNEASASAAVQGLVLKTKPDGPQTIAALKAAQPKAGDSVVLQGRIGGTGDPFVEGFSAFMLADDTAMAACDATEDDHCPKPWDYCCVKKSERSKNIITAQAAGEDGKVLAGTIAGLDGIQAGSFVVIKGTVASTDNDNLLVNIDGLFHDRERTVAKKGGHNKHDDHEHHDHAH